MRRHLRGVSSLFFMMSKYKSKSILFSFLFAALFLFTACGTSTPPAQNLSAPAATAPSDTTDPSTTAYVGPESDGYPNAASQGYISEDSSNPNVLAAPPNPEIETPQPASGGAIVGVLIREIVGEGFLPLTPRNLFLAKVILNSNGEPALLRRGDDAPQAQLLPTGIFIFNNIQPENYAIIADFGFTSFPLTDENGNQLLITIEEGKVVELGQIFVKLPE